MTDERSSSERRLEALDEQLAAFGIQTRPDVVAAAGDAAVLERHDTLVDDDVGTGSAIDTAETEIAPIAARPTDGVALVASSAGAGDQPVHRDLATDGGDDDASEDDVEDDDDDGPSRRRAVLDWVVVIGVALLVAFLVRTFVLAHFVVDGISMSTTLHDEDRVFVNKLSYRLHDPNRGDVVVLHQIEGTSSRDLIKRVVALPGETVEFRNCIVTIDGQVLEEPYIDPENTVPGQCGSDQAPLAVPADHVFVMGDNRGQSQDSRALGPIDEDNLVGRAFVVFWPRSSWQWL